MSSPQEFLPPVVPEYVPDTPDLLFVLNPGSNNYAQARRLTAAYLDNNTHQKWTDVVETSEDPLHTQLDVSRKLDKKRYDAVACLTGDGGANPVARVLLGRDVPLYLGGFGSINDGHVITVGGHERGAIANQPIVPIFPLETVVSDPSGEQREELALFYQGIGYTAVAAELVNGDIHRKSPLLRTAPTKKIREGMTVLKALHYAEAFEVEDLEAGPTRVLYEYLISNGRRMAGMPIYPGDPTSRQFKKVELASKPAIITQLGKLLLGHKADWQLAQQAEIRITAERPDEDVLMQFDGETVSLRSGTELRIRASRTPLYVVAPALAA